MTMRQNPPNRPDDIERGQYTDSDGIVWRIMQEWGEAVFGLEYQKADGTWECVSEVGGPQDNEDPAAYVRGYAEMEKEFRKMR